MNPTSADLLRHPTHPLLSTQPVCPKCGGAVILPAYPVDHFDCITCDWTKAPTAKQVKAMAAPRKN